MTNNSDQSGPVQHSVLDRLSTVPEAYQIGWVPFIHTNIYLDSRPLIPRTETEYWVFEVIKEIQSANRRGLKILDLCAGSGCIGVAVLKEIPDAQVDFAEIDKEHHETIRKNLRENAVEGRSQIFGGDLFESVSGKYEFILSNPPYLNPELSERVQESVLEHEPAQALFGGEKGLEIINRILAHAPKYLNIGGMLYIEHEPEQAEALSKHPMFLSSEKDQFGVLRYSKFSS